MKHHSCLQKIQVAGLATTTRHIPNHSIVKHPLGNVYWSRYCFQMCSKNTCIFARPQIWFPWTWIEEPNWRVRVGFALRLQSWSPGLSKNWAEECNEGSERNGCNCMQAVTDFFPEIGSHGDLSFFFLVYRFIFCTSMFMTKTFHWIAICNIFQQGVKETLILHSTGIIFWYLQQHCKGPSAQEYDVIVIGHSWGSSR